MAHSAAPNVLLTPSRPLHATVLVSPRCAGSPAAAAVAVSSAMRSSGYAVTPSLMSSGSDTKLPPQPDRPYQWPEIALSTPAPPGAELPNLSVYVRSRGYQTGIASDGPRTRGRRKSAGAACRTSLT